MVQGSQGSPIDSAIEVDTDLPYNASEVRLKQPLDSLYKRSVETDAQCASYNTPSRQLSARQAVCMPEAGPPNYYVQCVDQNGIIKHVWAKCPADSTCYQFPQAATEKPDIGCLRETQVEKGIGSSGNSATIITLDGTYSFGGSSSKRMNFDARTFDVNGNPIQVQEIAQYVNGHFAGSRVQTNVFDNDYLIGEGDKIHFEAERGTMAYVILQWTAKIVG
ncbi:hypothetical protein N7499_003198 [Penicillium canescens]|uniref:Uncharacterized protein n=1 Tax=Penicillium canescens TaxID=5083 RepID=A0AAD6I9S6_PENCN|nr:uncharacterized protein N7446_012105 [Penicillium canescens]KAJ5981541.1 hypothetical protein N7522_013577 [Penicillium canescens]KAJ6038606.1 hypothetical protein N7460_007323 [Penicillium canescens]KAJ6047271.1 hypothetical protein N7446_012105 [Penicillium canescens]KAJ6093867.1 hypothetical protein N7499_003198 [Penicillium canescens]KAJ6174347.1 hypothetical protein N7485_005413 [Penicillium canescens]